MATKTQVTWTSEEISLFEARLNEPMSVLIGLFPRHTRLAILMKRRRLGGGSSPEERSALARQVALNRDHDALCKVDQSLTLDDLDRVTWQVLIGSMLGDGGLKKNTGGRNRNHWAVRNYYFSTVHCEYQRPYVEWKQKKLAVFHPSRVSERRPEFTTCSHRIFTELRPLFYSGKTTRRTDLIPLLAFAELDMLGLLVWFLDDGTCGFGPHTDRHGRGVSFSIAGMRYGYDQLAHMAAVLNDRFGLHTSIRSNPWCDRMNHHLKFPFEDWPVLLPVWRQLFSEFHIPECMAYKVSDR